MSQREITQDPSSGQTSEEIKAYYEGAKIGDVACIRETLGGILSFVMTEITRRGVRTVTMQRLPSNGGGPAFYYDGRNWKFPGGQSRLVIPNPQIEEWNRKHPHGQWVPGALAVMNKRSE